MLWEDLFDFFQSELCQFYDLSDIMCTFIIIHIFILDITTISVYDILEEGYGSHLKQI